MFSLLNTDKSIEDIIYELKETHKLYVREEENTDLVLIKYDRNKSNFDEAIVNECRGIVVTREKKIICFPPERSIPLDRMTEIVGDNTENVRYEEHVDGTMINVFYNPGSDTWIKSTRSRIGANCNWLCNETFASLFNEASNDMDFNILDKELCYTFVLVHPKNRIVVKYDTQFICLVSVRRIGTTSYENLSLESVQASLLEKGLTVKIPTVYKFATINKMREHVLTQDSKTQGIIVKYENYRAKMRNAEYVMLRKLKGNTPNIADLYLRLRKDRNVKPFLKHFTEFRTKFNEVRDDIHQITYRLYNWYVNVFINKYCGATEIPYEFKPHCSNLHKQYIDSIKNKKRQRITLNKVISYVNQLPIYSLVFIRKHYIERIEESLN